jgi:predicted Zn-dependent protease
MTRTVMLRSSAHAAAAAALLAIVAGAAAGSARGDATGSDAARPVYLQPLGGFPRDEAAALVRHFERTLGISVDVLPTRPLDRTAFDRGRKQYDTEALFASLRRTRNARNPAAALIALTTEDAYSRAMPSWRFVFGTRSADGLAVVSRARMDPRFIGLSPDVGLRTRRLQKMVLRNIGVLAYGLALSGNARSALYQTILSTDDLDFMSEELRPPASSRARRAWLTDSTRACERGIAENKSLVARSSVTTRAGFLTFARESVRLEQRHYDALEAVRPASEDRNAVRALLGRFKTLVADDKRAVARLTSQWNDKAASQWVDAGLRAGLALKSGALELGSGSCGRYFDPFTYR